MRSALLLALTAAAACGPTVAGSAGGNGAPSSSGPTPAPVGTPASRGGRGPALAYQPYQGNPPAGGASARQPHVRAARRIQLRPGVRRSAYLSFQFSAAPTGSHAVITLDSIRLDPGQGSLPIPFDSIRAAEGARWTADLLPTGRLANVTASDSGVVASQMGGDLQLLFPVLPPGGARSGAEWTDTSQTVIATSVVNTHRTARLAVSWDRFRATGWDHSAGVPDRRDRLARANRDRQPIRHHDPDDRPGQRRGLVLSRRRRLADPRDGHVSSLPHADQPDTGTNGAGYPGELHYRLGSERRALSPEVRV